MEGDEKNTVIRLLEGEEGYKALFCPGSLIKGLVKLGEVSKAAIFPRSHKCEFRVNHDKCLTEFRVRTNTYARMAKRAWRQEPSTGVVLKECIVPLVWGLEVASTYPQFAENYQAIRDGLYALMICYSYDEDVKQVIAALLDCLPRDLNVQRLPTLQSE